MPFGREIKDFPVESNSDVSETFADSLGEVTFDGQSLRVEFCVTRVGELKPPKPPTGKRHIVARVVLTPEGAIHLLNAAQQIGGALKQAGVIKDIPNPENAPTGTVN